MGWKSISSSREKLPLGMGEIFRVFPFLHPRQVDMGLDVPFVDIRNRLRLHGLDDLRTQHRLES
jgi:hypothetical protein